MSEAVSAQYPVACPVCGAAPSRPCRTRTTGEVTDTHLSRIDAAAGSTTARALDRRPEETEER